MTEKYQQEVDTLKALVASQEEKIESLVDELEKIESKYDYETTHKCDFTDAGRLMIVELIFTLDTEAIVICSRFHSRM